MRRKHWMTLSRRIALFMAVLELLLFLLLAFVGVWLLRNGQPVVVVVLALMFAAQLALAYYWIYRPYRDTEKILLLFARGVTLEGISELELIHSPGTAGALQRVRQLLDTNQLVSASKRQAQYLALQNQINPHFLYNTLEGIRGEALGAGLEHVARMTEALGTFFRYTISNLENLATLEQELANVENYFFIQQYRFGERLALDVRFDSETDRRLLLKCRMPKLTLQPVVENAIVHGIEGKIGKGTVGIKVIGTANRMIVTVSDDGIGMERSQLNRLNQKLQTVLYEYVQPESDKQGGIALVNVNNRIQLLFGEDYGVSIYSTPGLGTDVEIALPYIDQNREVDIG